MSRSLLLLSALAALACAVPSVLLAQPAAEAEIVSVTGKGEHRDSIQVPWLPAAPKHKVRHGGFVRTLDLSQMAILLPDRTQIRLNQNSQIQIKTIADATEWNRSTVRLNSGRAWSQARPPTAPAAAGAPPVRLTVETPSATLSIRGTDWEVEVGPDGRTQLVVLSGEVDMGNEHGALKIGAGQAAAAEIGRAPVRLLLANPAERVQWVTAWQPQPRRWIGPPGADLAAIVERIEAGDYAAAAQGLERLPASRGRDVLAADLAMTSGDRARAVALLGLHAEGDADASALLARVHLAAGDAAAAAAVLGATQASHPRAAELRLANADLAIFRGDVRAARAALADALDIDAAHADAWLALGSIETERENVRAGRDALTQALAARPGFARALAERATLETLAGNAAPARDNYEQALAAAPDDYVALTGRGLLRLKTGDARGALDDFLRAGVVEPRYARAWLYSAAAFYQLGETKRATEALVKASRLDPNDPLPHVLRGIMAADALELGVATEAARTAQERMPFLKSLNQVLNNQKGSANLGSSLAAFGMEDWARHYATLAYSPWWAGSHLFLADRYTTGYNKNSELFKGFITDPTVFGAPQRHSSLVPTPGHHGRVDLFLEQADWQQDALIGTANGMTATPVPLAYFVSGDRSYSHSRLSAHRADGTNLTLGLGMRPHHTLGIFAFGTHTRIRGRLKNSQLPDDPLDSDETRGDLGLNFRYDAQNQFWLKGGSGRQATRVDGTIALPPTVPLDIYATRVTQRDLQFRHAVAPAEGVWVSWGFEDSDQSKPAAISLANGLLTGAETTDLRSRDAYATLRMPLTERLHGEIGAFVQRARLDQTTETIAFGTATRTANRRDFGETHWRGGVQWRYGARSTLTAVAQKWRRPAAAGSLAPIDTLGIAVNDRLTTNGGRYRRGRLQLDHEATAATFAHGFVDHETIANLTSPSTAVVRDLGLSQLESLRSRRDAFSTQPELEEAPQFLDGRMRSFGFAVNHRTSRDHTLALRYRRAHAQQTGANTGLRIPYMSRDYLRLSSHWSLPQRWLLGATATWRGERFRNEANTDLVDAGWAFGMTAYWESADKRWVMQAVLDQLGSNHRAVDKRTASAILRLSYLF